MGFYLNPEIDKREWLEKYGKEIPLHESIPSYHQAKKKEMLLVCLVDNMSFTSASIAFSENEREIFFRPDDRIRDWFLVPKKLILEQVPKVEAHLE